MTLVNFWLALSIASLVWYVLLIFYVGFRGAFDIRDMLRNLAANSEDEPPGTDLNSRGGLNS
jgi:hypothetical protein